LPQFHADDSPNLLLLSHVLQAFAVYNRDTGYVQGMGDFLSPLIVTLIQNWDDADHAVLVDNTKVDRSHAEALMFWMLCGIMSEMQQDRMFTQLHDQEVIAMERVFRIVQVVHKPLKKWLRANQLTDLLFLYRPLLLLFKREFSGKVVCRIWESFLAAEKPFCLPRFFLAAALILMFPKLMLRTDGTVGEVMSKTDQIFPEVDGLMALNLAIGLQAALAGEQNEMVFDNLPEKAVNRDYQPRFLNL
jgi:hypothetical protein